MLAGIIAATYGFSEGNLRRIRSESVKNSNLRAEVRNAAGTGERSTALTDGAGTEDANRLCERAGAGTENADDLTVADWVTQWYDLYAKPNIRPSTQKFYWNHIRFHIIPQIGKIKLRKLTSRDVQKLYNHVKKQGRVNAKNGKTELSNSYVRGLHMMLHNCMERAVKERLIPRNPTEDCIIRSVRAVLSENIPVWVKSGSNGDLKEKHAQLKRLEKYRKYTKSLRAVQKSPRYKQR